MTRARSLAVLKGDDISAGFLVVAAFKMFCAAREQHLESTGPRFVFTILRESSGASKLDAAVLRRICASDGRSSRRPHRSQTALEDDGHRGGLRRKANRVTHGFYRCRSCGWRAQADVNGALNIYERAYKVSPAKGSRGLVTKLVVMSYLLGVNMVYAPCCISKQPSLMGRPDLRSGEDVI